MRDGPAAEKDAPPEPAMYSYVLGAHNLMRWAVLAAGAWVMLLAWRGWLRRSAWTPREGRAVRMFVGVLDAQFVLGLLLYVALSPLTRQAFRDVGSAMRDAPVRYFFVEHLLIMVAAIAIAHIGAARVKRATADAARYQLAVIWLGAALAAILGFIPWARPLVPTF